MPHEELIRDCADALERRTAAVFIGAGLSRAAGFPDWKELLRGLAESVGLDVDREQDLPLLTQFYLNEAAQNRASVNQLIVDHFRRPTGVPENHRILTRLPFTHLWTSNYDELIEQGFELAGKRLDVKSRNANLTTSDRNADAVLFKMHGTATHPDEAVLSKDDYETYATTRPGFLQILGSDLITRTFLFLGLSFTDPNLAHIMGALRASFRSAPRTHYTILRRPSDPYELRRFELFARDLQRYGVRVCLVDEFDEITQTLTALERAFAQRNVFVAGSFPEDGDPAERRFIEEVSRRVGRILARRGLRLISGFGRVVGPAVVSGMVEALYGGDAGSRAPSGDLGRRMTIRPNRNVSPEGISLAAFKRRYREDMIAQAGIVLVIGGLRGGGVAPGVMEEFEIAEAQGKIVLPIAATGHAAKQIHEALAARPANQLPAEIGAAELRDLGEETRSEERLEAIVDACLGRIRHRR